MTALTLNVTGKTETGAAINMTLLLNKVSKWVYNNKLLLNWDKTKIMTFSNKHIKDLKLGNIFINDIKLENVLMD